MLRIQVVNKQVCPVVREISASPRVTFSLHARFRLIKYSSLWATTPITFDINVGADVDATLEDESL